MKQDDPMGQQEGLRGWRVTEAESLRAERQEAQRLIEEEMPEGYTVMLECSPGDWSMRFTDPEGEDIRFFIRKAVQFAKARAALTTKEQA